MERELVADPGSGRMTTSLDPNDEMVCVKHKFPHGTLVVPGKGQFQNEIWMLPHGDESTEHWNYWLVMVATDAVNTYVIDRTVPWWGYYYRDWHERQLARSNPPNEEAPPNPPNEEAPPRKMRHRRKHARRSNPPNE